jgi:hypothetical protein
MFLVDTSSWLSLAKYFLPFDRNSLLKNVLSKKLEVKEIVIIDKVFDECRGVGQRIVVNSLPFLKTFLRLLLTMLRNRGFIIYW